jgi:hypothetical protein
MKDKDFSDVGVEGGGVAFQDDRFRVAHAPAADPGAVIAYEYEQRSRPFVTEETWFLQGSIPHLSQSFTLELPSGYTFGTVWAHHAPIQAAELEHQRWRWEANGTAGIDLERIPMSPSPESLAARMTVHYAGPGLGATTDGTWKSIGEWYAQIAKDRLLPSPEIAAKAQALADGKSDFYDKTEANRFHRGRRQLHYPSHLRSRRGDLRYYRVPRPARLLWQDGDEGSGARRPQSRCVCPFRQLTELILSPSALHRRVET